MKKAKLFMMLALLVMGVSNLFAQNVTISTKNGNMIVAQTQSDTGSSSGAFATWKHNQLSLTMTGSNSTTLTEDGQFASHANHFQPGSNCAFSQQAQHPETDYSSFIVAGWGTAGGTMPEGAYISISLPKGYRFTGLKS